MKILNNLHDDCCIIYILGNKSMKNTFKIGKTIKRNLYSRVADLSSRTAVPQPFDIVGIIIDEYGNGYDLERKIFDYFNIQRISSNREFFFFENSDDLLNHNYLCNKKIIWNDKEVINYSNSLQIKSEQLFKNKYITLIKRREKIINELFKRRHNTEFRTSNINVSTETPPYKPTIIEKIKKLIAKK